MSTPVALAIALVLYLLSCVRAWQHITRPDRITVKEMRPKPLPSNPSRHSAADGSKPQRGDHAMH